MPETRDGYAEWLGITTPKRPLSHYQLLGLADFESNPAKIVAAADAALARVQQKSPGPRAAEWQKILDQLSMAKLVLCNSARKGQYDGQLRSKLSPAPNPQQANKSDGRPSGQTPKQAASDPRSQNPSGGQAPRRDQTGGSGVPRTVTGPATPDYSMPPAPGGPIGPATPAQPNAYLPAPEYQNMYPPGTVPPQAPTYGGAPYPQNYPQAPQQYASPQAYGEQPYSGPPPAEQQFYPQQPGYPPQQQPQYYPPSQYPQQPYPQQQYPPQQYPQQPYPPQQYPQQVYPPNYQAAPNAGYPPPGYPAPPPNNYAPPTGYGQTGYPPPDYGAQAQYPQHAHQDPNAGAPGYQYPPAVAPAGFAPPGYDEGQGYTPDFASQDYAAPGSTPPEYAPYGYSPPEPGDFEQHPAVPDFANEPTAAQDDEARAPVEYASPQNAFYPPEPLTSAPVRSQSSPTHTNSVARRPMAEQKPKPEVDQPAKPDSNARPKAALAPAIAAAKSASPSAKPDGVVIRNSVRPELIAPKTPAKPQAREGMSARQRQVLYIGSGLAAALVVLMVTMMTPPAARETAQSAPPAIDSNHLNPLGTRPEPKPNENSAAPVSHGEENSTAQATAAAPKTSEAAPPETKRRRRAPPTPKPSSSADESSTGASESTATDKPMASGSNSTSANTTPVESDSTDEMVAQAPANPRPAGGEKSAGVFDGLLPPGASTKKTVDPEQAAAFDNEVLRARGALAARDIPQAQAALKAATALAVTPDQKERHLQIKLLTRYVDGFWNAVRKSMAGLQATDELKVGNTTLSVVSADENELTLHRPGRNETFTIAKMPSGLATVLAERWFHGDVPANKIFLGAFQAVDPNGELAEARRLWSEATRAGASAETLMPLLDTPRVPPLGSAANNKAAGAKIGEGKPDKEALTKAKESFNQKHGPDVRAATDVEKKLALSQSLAEESKNLDDPAEQSVWFENACKLVAEAAGKPSAPSACAAISEQAIELIDRAIEEKRVDLLSGLPQRAIIAARKSRDDSLLKKANERSQKLAEMAKGATDN